MSKKTFLVGFVIGFFMVVGTATPVHAGIDNRIEFARIAGETENAFNARLSAVCPTNRACVWSGYWDAADQGSLWYYTYAQLQNGVSWSGTGADLNTSSWYNRLNPIGTAGAPFMLMANNASCSTSIGFYVRLASGQVANGRNPATNWNNAFRSIFTQPPSPC